MNVENAVRGKNAASSGFCYFNFYIVRSEIIYDVWHSDAVAILIKFRGTNESKYLSPLLSIVEKFHVKTNICTNFRFRSTFVPLVIVRNRTS